MKTVLAGLAAAALAVLALPGRAGTGENAPPAPRIRVEPESFDFGKARPGKVLRKEFTIRNFGDAPLVIEGVRTTCGCTAALSDESRVPPGGATALRVSFD
ncbi:MAG TPA: DUF1573 domain-containing protein, partial [Vicinamibacteria bacterium]